MSEVGVILNNVSPKELNEALRVMDNVNLKEAYGYSNESIDDNNIEFAPRKPSPFVSELNFNEGSNDFSDDEIKYEFFNNQTDAPLVKQYSRVLSK